MVQLIVGKKGKGKTTQLLNKLTGDIKKITRMIIYIAKLTNKI